MSNRKSALPATLLRGLLASSALGFAALAASPAAAQALDERIWIEGSLYIPSIDTTMTVSQPGLPGTVINVEEDLDLDDSETLPALYGGWRFGERWIVAGEFYALDRDGKKAISRDIVFDGTTYPVGASIGTNLKSDIYRVNLGYSIFHGESSEFGASIGLHATEFDVQLVGEAQVGPNTREVVARRRNFLAPMPTIGLYGAVEATPKVVLNGRVDFLSLDLDDYGGGITQAQASVAYRFTPMFSMGAAYRFVSYDLEVNKPTYDADFDYEFSGLSLFLRFGFQ